MAPKYIFVTGGVVSSLGKGVAASSIGCLLESRGFKVNIQKCDPYLNVDPGTMSPFQHGEVFVTEDGAETDLDIGHYERFIDENLSRAANHTSGAVWDRVLCRRRRGGGDLRDRRRGRLPRADRAARAGARPARDREARSCRGRAGHGRM